MSLLILLQAAGQIALGYLGAAIGAGLATIGAVGYALLLLALHIARFASGGVKSYHRIGTEASRVFLVDHARATEYGPQCVASKSHGLLSPVNEVGRCSMPPRHITPVVTLRVILIEEMIYPICKDHSVRVVHPVLGRSEGSSDLGCSSLGSSISGL